ncbi:MAG: MFS transporter [Deltaproteobacteria bacterium]|jgi:predicted MFS family arabinose efflux permease|nr:MFS transporter [Deltaproteobacteria bacterium]
MSDGCGQAASGKIVTGVGRSLWSGAFLTLFCINVCLFGSMNMLLATMPIHFQDHGMSEGMIGFIFGAFYASSISSRLLTGRLAGRLGELGLLKAAVLTAALGNGLMLSGDGFWVYLVTRFVNGAGIGTATTLMISLASKIIPPARLAEGLGRLALGASLALAFGPFLGLKLAETCGFPMLLAATCLLLTLAFAAVTTRSSSDFPSLPDTVRVPDKGPPPEGRRLPERELVLPALLVLLLGGACCGIFTYLVLYLDELRIRGAASFFFIATMGIVITRLMGGRIHDRLGHMFVIVPSSLLLMGSLLILLAFPGPVAANVAAACYGLGMGALFPSLQAITITYAPPAKRTLAAALFLNGYDVGYALNTVAMGCLAELFHTYRIVYAATPVFMVAVLLVYCLNPVFDNGRRSGTTGGV